MDVSLAFLGVSFVYICFLNILFFRKEHIKNNETAVFSKLLIVNLFGVLIETSCIFSIYYLGTQSLVVKIVNKIFLLYFLTFLILFNDYVITVIYSNISAKKQLILTKLNRVLYLISSLMVILLPIGIYYKDKTMYSYGASTSVIYIVSFICVIIWIIQMIVHMKEIKRKKCIPLIAYIIGASALTLIQKMNPALTLTTSMETFLMFIMYHTIENPDIKLIQELNLARDQAEKANNAKTEFLSSMSHEIRTPLNAIVGFSQALLEEDIPDSSKDEINDIVMASDSLLEIVNGILDISKIEANKLEIINTEYNIDKIVKELVPLTKTRIGEKPIEFKVNVDPTIPKVLYGDHTRLKQVILNLLTNAAKYTKEGWIEFKIASVIKNDICRLIISVEDTGIGIKPEKIDKLFTKFDRLGVEENITIEGTGLGLAITKKLVELMHGNIVVQSVYGKGSKFTVAIDQKVIATEAKETKEITNADIESVDCSGKKILVVDDNKVNLKVAERLLKSYNVEVTTVSSGFECIEKINNNEIYDLILMDDMMPKMSGTETLHQLKKIETFKIPVVALTANAISGMKDKYLNEGFNDYLSKPIQKPELNSILIKFLKGGK